MKNNLLITVIVSLLVGGVAFYGGMKHQQSKLPNFGGRIADGQRGVNNTRPSGLRTIMGEVISKDDQSITVKLNDGSSKIVILSETTQINKASEAAIEDLVEGETISAFGTENSDGSITAQNIQMGNRLFDSGN